MTNVESEYLTAGEAAKLLMVSPKTVTRWADAGRIPHAVTLGGHRRFRREEIDKIAEAMGQEPLVPPALQDAEIGGGEDRGRS